MYERNCKKVLMIAIILLIGIILFGSENKAYAYEQTKTIKGYEINDRPNAEMKKFKNESEYWYEPKSVFSYFGVRDENGIDESLGLGDIGMFIKSIIGDQSYYNKTFIIQTTEYVGKNISIEVLGNFEFAGKVKDPYDGKYYYEYKCKITNQKFRKPDGMVSYFQLEETDVKTGEKIYSRLFLSFHRLLYIDNEITGVKLEGNTAILPEDAKLYVENIENTDGLNINKEKVKAFDININKGEEKIQPLQKVKIKIPIPEDFDEKGLEVYRIEENENIKYDVEVLEENNKKYATFKTDHFSKYVLAGNQKQIKEEIKEENKPVEENKPTEEKPENNEEIKNETSNEEIKQEIEKPKEDKIETEENKNVEKQETEEKRELDDEPKAGIKNNMIIIMIALISSLLGMVYIKTINKGL